VVSQRVDLAPRLQNKRLRLIFDGIDFEAEIWLNDQQLGTRADSSALRI